MHWVGVFRSSREFGVKNKQMDWERVGKYEPLDIMSVGDWDRVPRSWIWRVEYGLYIETLHMKLTNRTYERKRENLITCIIVRSRIQRSPRFSGYETCTICDKTIRSLLLSALPYNQKWRGNYSLLHCRTKRPSHSLLSYRNSHLS